MGGAVRGGVASGRLSLGALRLLGHDRGEKLLVVRVGEADLVVHVVAGYALHHTVESEAWVLLVRTAAAAATCTLLGGGGGGGRKKYNWASVSEPHTCDFNAAFSLYICMLYIYIYATVTVLLTLRSIFQYFI